MESQVSYEEEFVGVRLILERYYRQQEWAVRQIAIDNIRQAKERELFERRRVDLNALNTRSSLVPDLSLIALAWISLWINQNKQKINLFVSFRHYFGELVCQIRTKPAQGRLNLYLLAKLCHIILSINRTLNWSSLHD